MIGLNERTPVLVGDHTIHIRKVVAGHTSSIILIHGIGVSSDYYIPYAAELAAKYDVYVVDLPGYGKTPKPRKPLMIKQLAAVLNAYVTMLHLDTVIIVGQSMGSQIVVEAVVTQTDLYKKVLVLAPTTNSKERSLLLQGLRLAQDTVRESPKANYLVFVNYMRMGVFRYLVTAKDMIRYRTDETLRSITLPVLVVYGTRDPIAPKEWAEYLASQAPHGSVAAVKDAPHLLQFQKPKTLATITNEFIYS
jgi:pimeloyl-ACP methyl ester carboxylesterase